jgi:ketosteroid isomerase-like protein
MSAGAEVMQSEDRFFAALTRGDRADLLNVMGDECVLIDVMTGSEVPQAVFVDLVGSQRLVFDSIDRLEGRVRLYDTTAIVTGRTRMSGRYEGHAFRVHSRYTHVYARGRNGWRLVSAQGTPVAEAAA